MNENNLAKLTRTELLGMAKLIDVRVTTKMKKADLIQAILGNEQVGSGDKTQKKEDLAVFKNADKEWHEQWESNRGVMNLPHPFRCILFGPPNSGKTSMILNLLMENDPYFEEVIVIHCDPEYTKEYDMIKPTMLKEIPAPENWEGEKKTLVILDDLEYKNMSKDQRRNLDRLFGFVSTHKNISVCLSSQDAFNIPTSVRRCGNVWVLWKIDDEDCVKTLSRKIRLKSKTIMKLFNDYLLGPHDSLMIDNTANSPYRVRKNGTEVIPPSEYNI